MFVSCVCVCVCVCIYSCAYQSVVFVFFSIPLTFCSGLSDTRIILMKNISRRDDKVEVCVR